MTQQDKMDLLYSIQSVLEVADADLSWDTLPNRYRIQDALKYTNTLIALEKNKNKILSESKEKHS
jgi:hypothetical protein